MGSRMPSFPSVEPFSCGSIQGLRQFLGNFRKNRWNSRLGVKRQHKAEELPLFSLRISKHPPPQKLRWSKQRIGKFFERRAAWLSASGPHVVLTRKKRKDGVRFWCWILESRCEEMTQDGDIQGIGSEKLDPVQGNIGTKNPQAMRFSQSLGTSGLAGEVRFELTARGFGVDVGGRTRKRGMDGTARLFRTSPKRVVLVWCCEKYLG